MTPSPSPPGDQNLAETDIESPSCGDCTQVAQVPSGTTRYIVTKTMPGQDNCYRIIATAGLSTSLYTPQECVFIEGTPTPGTSGTSAPGTSPTPGVCPPSQPLASALTSTSIAITWLPPTEYKASEASSTSGKGKKKYKKWKKGPFTTADRGLRSAVKAGGGTSSSTTTTAPPPCNPQLPVTGFELQRQLLDGWTTITPAPTASDSAMEVGGLQPSTKYCFRMRSQATPSPSGYTGTFCAKTLSASAPATPAPTLSPSPTPSAAPIDPTGAPPTPAAAIILEGIR